MKIFLLSIGTRGDIEPFVAIGSKLEQMGYEVAYAFPQQLTSLIHTKGAVYPLSSGFIELIESKEGRQVMGKAPWFTKLRSLLFLYRKGREVNRDLVREQYEAIQREKPDLLIHHPKCSYPVLWSMATNNPSIILSPVPYVLHRVKGHAHVGFPENLGPLNRLSFTLSNIGFTTTVYDAQKALPVDLNFSWSQIKRRLLEGKIMYTISPALFPRPSYWPPQAEVVGFHEKINASPASAHPLLEDFLRRHSKVLLLTFGSMVNYEPDKISRFLYEILDELHIPTVVNTASGGLMELTEFKENKNFYFTEGLPYDYAMEKVYAVIHHGGSGTTHMSLKNACPCLIIPHIIDQYIWNRKVYELGAGPLGISINNLPSRKLKKKIKDLYTNKSYKLKAQELARSMKENHTDQKLFEFLFNENYARTN